MKNKLLTISLLFASFLILHSSYGQGLVRRPTIDSLERVLKTQTDKESVETRVLLLEAYRQFDVIKAIEYGKQAENILRNPEISNWLQEQKVKRGLGVCYFQLSNYSLALKHFQESIELCIAHEYWKGAAGNYNNIAAIYLSMKEYEKSIEYFKKALPVFEKMELPYEMGTVCSNMGHVFLEINQVDSAAEYVQRSIEINRSTEQNDQRFIRDNLLLSRISKTLGKYDEGIRQANTALHIMDSTQFNNPNLKAEIFGSLSELYFGKNEVQKGIEYINRMMNEAKKVHSFELLKDGYFRLSKIYEAEKAWEKANENLHLYLTYTDSVLNEAELRKIYETEAYLRIKEVEQQLETSRKDQLLLERKDVILRQRQFILVGGVIIFILVSISLFVYFRNRVRKLKLEEDILTTRLDYSQKEMETIALSMIQKNDGIKVLKEKLETIRKMNQLDDQKKALRSLIIDLNSDLGIDEDQHLIKSKISETENIFLSKLNSAHPGLSDNEIQLAVLIRSKFSSKEIASLLNIEHNSVNVNRYRLRKKLGLGKEQNLVDYLINL